MKYALSLLVVALASSILGCALTSKSDPVLLRYYSLDSPRPRPHPPGSPATGAAPLQLRLGRVNAASYIRDHIAFRDSNVEIGYYDDLRWTEMPESYVRRDLSRALFEDEGVQEIVGGIGPTLDVDVDSFEELREPKHVAVVQLSWQLRDDTVVLMRRTVSIQRPLEESPKDKASQKGLAMALSGALDEAVDQVVRAVVPKLAVTPSASPDATATATSDPKAGDLKTTGDAKAAGSSRSSTAASGRKR
jgi:ABC-type uncharacterized transport system auxiliary subunit